MEYCITVLVETFGGAPPLRPPRTVMTAWGPATREAEGRLYYGDNLHVQPVPLIPHILRLLPEFYRDLDWVCLSVGGEGLREFGQHVNRGEESDVDAREPALPQLVRLLLQDQRRWVVCLEKDCDQIDVTRTNQSVDDVVASIVEAYTWNAEGPLGFCSVST